ncbi:hypothetical protein [Streptomyces sp. P9-A4]
MILLLAFQADARRRSAAARYEAGFVAWGFLAPASFVGSGIRLGSRS